MDVECDMQNPVAVSQYADLRRSAACSTATSAVALTGLQTATRNTCSFLQHFMRDCSLAILWSHHQQKNASYSSRISQKQYVRAFSSESATLVIRLRRPRKVYTIDDAICSLLEVIDALKNHSQALEQEGKLCNMTSAAKKSKN